MKIVDVLAYRIPTWPKSINADYSGITQNAAGVFIGITTEGIFRELNCLALEGLPILEDNGLVVSKDEWLKAKNGSRKVHDHACVNCFTDKGPCLGECNITDTNKVLTNSFEAVTKPVIKWLKENSNPHTIIVIDPNSATLHTGEIGFSTEEFLKD